MNKNDFLHKQCVENKLSLFCPNSSPNPQNNASIYPFGQENGRKVVYTARFTAPQPRLVSLKEAEKIYKEAADCALVILIRSEKLARNHCYNFTKIDN